MYLLTIVLFLIPVGNHAGFLDTVKQFFNRESTDHLDFSNNKDTTGNIDKHPSWKYLPTDSCGKTRSILATRIVGGEVAKLGEFPFICQLGYKFRLFNEEPEFICGCTLISKYYVLTAAHCGDENNLVRLGENDRSTKIDCQGSICAPHVQDIRVKKYLLKLYNKHISNQNDINMILLEKPAQFNDFVIPACLPRGPIISENLTGKRVQVAGWGLTDSSDEYSASQRLMYMEAPVVDNEICNNIFHHQLASSQYCVGYNRDVDTCNGDSGGPLFRYMRIGRDTRIYLLGITSFGLTDCGQGQGVYTRVASFLPQILDNIKQ